MARILVRHNGKFRLWCDTVDQWVSPLLSELDMAFYLVNSEQHGLEEAIKRIKRTKYPKKQLVWLKDYFDSKYKQLCRLSRKNRAFFSGKEKE